MTEIILPGTTEGTIEARPSKSRLHRLIICSFLAGSQMKTENQGEDIRSTHGCIAALLAGGRLLDCGESGSTLRFLLPVAAALGKEVCFAGRGRLPERPMLPLIEALESHGIEFSSRALPFEIKGKLTCGDYRLPGNVSSQYISGLLMALPLLEGHSTITLTAPLESKGYVEMTISVLREFGIRVYRIAQGWFVPGNQSYTLPESAAPEGDWSNAAFWLVAGAIGGKVTVTGLDTVSSQGDRAIIEYFRQMKVGFEAGNGYVTAFKSEAVGCTLDLRNTPDLLPPLAVLAAFGKGSFAFTGVSRLRLKESDRLTSTAELICSLGGKAEVYDDKIIVHGTGLAGGAVNGHNDHRIVMAAAIAALGCREPVEIMGAEAVNKSYPEFFKDIQRLTKDKGEIAWPQAGETN